MSLSKTGPSRTLEDSGKLSIDSGKVGTGKRSLSPLPLYQPEQPESRALGLEAEYSTKTLVSLLNEGMGDRAPLACIPVQGLFGVLLTFPRQITDMLGIFVLKYF